MRNCKWIIPVLLLPLFFSCSNDDGGSSTTAVRHVVKVAVLSDNGEQARWQRTAEWALKNMAEAQKGLPEQVELQLTFVDQDADDIDEKMRELAKDTTIAAIVGPTTSALAEKMASKLGTRKAWNKPMLTPSATHVEYQRKFSSVPYVWNMAESDIAQIEVLVSKMAVSGNSRVELLTAYDGSAENNTYAEWFGFIAEEYGLSVEGVYLYKNADDVRRYVRQLCGSSDVLDINLVFDPSSADIVKAFDDEIGRMKAEERAVYTPFIYCSDAFVSDQTALEASHAEYRGVDLYASPESGFHQAYLQHFGQKLASGEAQFYDALCLVAYAATLSAKSGQKLNDAMLSVVEGNDGKGGSWLPADMSGNFQQLQAGQTPDIDGVSSAWTFDEQTHSTVAGSTFRLWTLVDGQFVTTEYVSTEGGKRTSSSKNIWDWTASKLQTFNPTEGSTIVYPALRDRWALLIAASTGWGNYRFQADVFAMYQILRQHGYEDDHIVLICPDDAANNAKNIESGELRVSDDGPNLYAPEAIDYRLADLSPSDLADILQGRRSEHLPHVISPDSTDNVFVFWSSHGSVGSMDFGGNAQMTYQQMRNMLANTPHRKLLFAIEACYSGGLGKYCQGLPGMLFITAANPYETSHAARWSDKLGVYRSNGFTRGFQEAIGANSNVSLRDLYFHLATTTSGSHVKLYNTALYGNVYDNSISEYLGEK